MGIRKRGAKVSESNAVKEYAAALAGLNGEAIAQVRGDAPMLATWQQRGDSIGLVWAMLRDAGHDEKTIADLQRAVGRAIPPWWAEYEPDEAGQSDAFLDRYGADWGFVVGLERWHAWQGTHWHTDETRGYRLTLGRLFDSVYGEAMEQVQDLARDADELDAENKAALAKVAQYGKKPKPEDAEVAALATKEAENAADKAKQARGDVAAAKERAAGWRRTDRRLNAVDNLCRDRRAVHPDSVNAGNLLNLLNGTLDLDAYTMRHHDRADMLTHCLPYAFDPAATCGRWLQFLSEVLVKEDGRTPDPELIALFQEYVGYALTTETRYEAMLWLSGKGANGKSTATKIVNALLGELALKLDFSALGRPDASYYLARLGGARVVFSTEAATKTGEEILKQLVSGEPLSARPIRGEPITIYPVAKVIWAMNDKPDIKDTSDGFWRRLRLIPFHRQFAEHEKDTRLADRLLEELPGILNWALDGLRRLRAAGRFTDAAAVRDAVTEYRTEQNDVAQWLNERTTCGLPAAVRPEAARTKGREAFHDYLQWAKEINRQKTLTETMFGKELKKLVTCEKAGSVVYHFGLLVEPKDAPAHYSDTEAEERKQAEQADSGAAQSSVSGEEALALTGL